MVGNQTPDMTNHTWEEYHNHRTVRGSDSIPTPGPRNPPWKDETPSYLDMRSVGLSSGREGGLQEVKAFKRQDAK